MLDLATPGGLKGLLKALAARGMAREGVAAAGEPVELSSRSMGAVLDRWPVRANGAAGVN